MVFGGKVLEYIESKINLKSRKKGIKKEGFK